MTCPKICSQDLSILPSYPDQCQNLRTSSIDCRNLVITSLSTYSPYPSAIPYNGKSKLRTGVAGRLEGKTLQPYSKSPEISAFSIRSYYQSHPKDLSFKQRISNLRKDIHCSLDLSEKSAADFLIVKQSKMALYEAYNNRKKKLKTLFLSINQSTLEKGRKAKKIFEKVSFKEACKDKEWLLTVKPKIIHGFCRVLCKSNGLELSPSAEGHSSFKYALGQGNNSRLVKQIMSKRWWWTRVPLSEAQNSNFAWTQWRDQSFLDSLPSCAGISQTRLNPFQVFLKSEVFFIKSPSGRKIVDISYMGFEKITKSASFALLDSQATMIPQDLKVHNRVDLNFMLSNKKALYYNLKNYYMAVGDDPFAYIPVTFHVTSESDSEFSSFLEYYSRLSASLWILKPGENSNRGNGITLASSLESIKKHLKNNPFPTTGEHTYIIQKYIEKPFLVYKRKFDIRCFALLTSINNVLQCYFYEEGYIRTSSKKFSCSDINDLFIHLTNDAVQKKSENYGKYENGNKMTYEEFQKYLDLNCSDKMNFFEQVLPKMKEMVKDSVKAVFLKIDPERRGHSFEVFGYDFMLDENLKPWLIEVNTNPCLELSCAHLARIIPNMLDNAFRICLDPLFPEPLVGPKRPTAASSNRFELIFHSYTDGLDLVNSLIQTGRLFMVQEIDPCLKNMNENILNTSKDSLDDLKDPDSPPLL
jgi:hypothetical protein